jgi:Xaa-Pro aminopeptidase
MNRIDKLRQAAFKDKVNSFLVLNSSNILYFTGFSGAAALVIPENGEGTLYVSTVNYEQAKAETTGFNIEPLKQGENLTQKIVSSNLKGNAKTAVDSVSIEMWQALANGVGGAEKLVVAGKEVLDLRKIKDAQEIQSIRVACQLADKGVLVASEVIRPGISERDVAAEVEYGMRKAGSSGTSFDTIVASGASSAYPHGSCSNRTIADGDLVIVDLGATVNFYRSDITRTFVAGKASGKQRRIFDSVKTAQEISFKAVKPNALGKTVDAVARSAISKDGYGDNFVHNLGHGVGLEIHEAPTLSPLSKDVLTQGNVVTVEPGIYIVGFGGVRIEDTVLVNNSGGEKLTLAPSLFDT